jgi:hypothetical protein
MKQRHFLIELVNSHCCYNSAGSHPKANVSKPESPFLFEVIVQLKNERDPIAIANISKQKRF